MPYPVRASEQAGVPSRRHVVSIESSTEAVKKPTTEIAGWGRHPVMRVSELLSEDLGRISRSVALTRGLGRSYGDSSLPPTHRPVVAASRLADRVLSFDSTTGIVRAEAGLTLVKMNQLFLSRGWFTPVSPGTQYVTLGGMVASDVHGKNHHVAGCFGEHLRSLRMRVADGRVLEISDECEGELFRATLGGMGLTGHILEVELQLERVPTAWILSETERVRNLDELFRGLRTASRDWPFTVAWVDCVKRGRSLGRGVLIKGRWARESEAPSRFPKLRRRFNVPLNFPNWLLDTWSVTLFNMCFYHSSSRTRKRRIVSYEPFFYPLDSLHNWNRFYGKRGLTQYQCVLPHSDDPRVYHAFFETLTSRGGASFLSVLKDCGAEGKGHISFPLPGISIALDLAMRGQETHDLIDALNEIVISAGGRIYLTKDALTRPEHFRAMEPRLAEWNEVRRRWDPHGQIVSAQSVRLLGDRE